MARCQPVTWPAVKSSSNGWKTASAAGSKLQAASNKRQARLDKLQAAWY